ncbi:hypothetical protein BUALT_Bualt19G0112000 [Buddleja alternifolia]|uniref:Uncharacterized protein n=1 Tax=Buddleja alternifolia TaxID=168488 RepID=A0AAV6W6L4_9LAMI|nr:hypothetical protein BUALT_Bualt19G0112000 [Buddleja alternifolia]
MSSLVDIWTSEVAKLRSKDQANLSGGSAPTSHEAATVTAHADESSGSLWWPTGLAPLAQRVIEKLPALHCSEASLSMLVDSFTKVRSKDQANLSSGSAPTSHEAATVTAQDESSGSMWWPTGLAPLARRVIEKLPALHCSEASLSMLVDSFSA